MSLMNRPTSELQVENLRVESGNPARAKAAHREEALKEYPSRPLAERLQIARSMVGPRQSGSNRR